MPFSALISACLLDMNLSIRLIVQSGVVPMTVTGWSVNSSPFCGPCSGISQPSSCVPACPDGSMTSACVFSFCNFCGATAACCAICAQNGQASHDLSSCCSHCVQNFFLKIQKPVVRIGGLGLGPPPIPGMPGICGICGAPGIPGGIPGIPGIPGCIA